MITGYYSSVSGVHYNEQQLDVIANNMANVDTTGFRRSLMIIRSREENEYSNQIDPTTRKRIPTINGVERTGVFQNHRNAGRLIKTDNPLDVAIPSEIANGFFAVRRASGAPNEVEYTRNGTLSVGKMDPRNPNSSNVLYLGGHIALDGQMQPINVDPNAGPLSIGSDGSVMQGSQSLGQMPVYRFNKSGDPSQQVSSNLQQLEQMGDFLYRIPEKVKNEFVPVKIEAGRDGVDRLVSQGMREGSNVNPFQEVVDMMTASKTAEANKAAVKQQLDGLTKLFQMIRS